MVSKKAAEPNPMASANILAYLFFWWMNDFFKRGSKADLKETDFYDLMDGDFSTQMCDRLEREWRTELRSAEASGRRPSFLRSVVKTYLPRWLFYGTWELANRIIAVLNPFWLAGLIGYFDGSGTSLTAAYLYAVAITATVLTYSILYQWFFFKCELLGWELRVATCALMYKKTIRLSQKSLAKATTGHIINLGATDVIRFFRLFPLLHYIWLAPLQAFAVVYLLWREIGVSSLVSLAIIVIAVLSQSFFGRYFGRIRAKTAIQTDARVRIMSEILTAMRVVKFYAWEKPFKDLVGSLRRKEIRNILRSSYLKACNYVITYSSTRVLLLATIALYSSLGGTITSALVFTVLTWFTIIRIPLGVFFSAGVEKLAETRISLKRIESFLLLDEIEIPLKKSSNVKVTSPPLDTSIDFREFTAYWDDVNMAFKEDNEDVSSDRNDIALEDINLAVRPGQLVAVVGPVASGKSSMLSAILGELPAKLGSVDVTGRISYVSQVPWVFSASVRDNILFGEEFDQERYDSVVEACGLVKDIKSFKYGSDTLVGERGVTLSGGQKARVNLARAAYRFNSEIYLLDDPLSAVDVAVANQIFDQCICGFLKHKTRVLVTHQLQYLKEADCIVVLKQGKMSSVGTFADLQTRETDFSEWFKLPDDASTTDFSFKDTKDTVEHIYNGDISFHGDITKIKTSENKNVADIIEEQPKSQGSIGWQSYVEYIVNNKLRFAVLLILVVVNQSLYVLCDWWISVWAAQSQNFVGAESSSPRFNLSVSDGFVGFNNYTNTSIKMAESDYDNTYYMNIFSCLTAGFVIVMLSLNILQNYHLVVSGRRMHDRMLLAILRAPIRFFDTNPVGRILNRFSKDMGQVDEILPWVLMEFVQTFTLIVSILILAAVINYFVLFVIIPLVIYFLWLRQYYLKTSRDIMRFEGASRSPVFSHQTSTLQGMTTIRAFGMQESFENTFHYLQDVHSRAWFMYQCGTRWLSFRLDAISVLFIGGVAFLFLLTTSLVAVDASQVGLTLAYAVQLMGIFQWCVRLSTEVENQMTSVERIQEYCSLPREAPHNIPTSGLDPGWPSSGRIKFDNLSFAHYKGGPEVLHRLSFEIQPGEKLGIVGRTGAGKSSIIAALFRLNEHSAGRVLIDGVDISTIGLTDLRSSISVIPQDPTLFAGSLRKNIDPFSIYTDDQLWNALEKVEMNEYIESFPAKLEMAVSEAGSNFSVGQRQLLCLARAILRQNKILVIDEATANVDLRTDELIQKTIRKTFEHCTVITVAHRVETIIDCNRIMAISDGAISELDEPCKLLSKPESVFNEMVKAMGVNRSEALRAKALKNGTKRNGNIQDE